MAIGKREAITRWIFYTWFVVEFGVLANKNCVEALLEEVRLRIMIRSFEEDLSGESLGKTSEKLSSLYEVLMCVILFSARRHCIQNSFPLCRDNSMKL